MATTKKKKTTKAKTVVSKPVTKKPKKVKKQRMEFSKIIFLCTSILFTLVVIGSFALMWHTSDISALVCLITTTGAMVTANIALYTQKAKAENIIKISKEHNLTIDESNKLFNSSDINVNNDFEQ